VFRRAFGGDDRGVVSEGGVAVPTWAWIVIVVVAIALVLAALPLVASRRRRERLKGRFGPEYEQTVAKRGGRREAERELQQREEKRQRLRIVPLSPEARDRYLRSWRDLQERFVDEPSQSMTSADQLVTEVMRERGYPMDEFEQRADDVSVDHPRVVENYRSAHRIYVAEGNGTATTEDLRQAVIHYRALFDELLETDEQTDEEVGGGAARRADGGAGGDSSR
jgi:hypothetical protein